MPYFKYLKLRSVVEVMRRRAIFISKVRTQRGTISDSYFGFYPFASGLLIIRCRLCVFVFTLNIVGGEITGTSPVDRAFAIGDLTACLWRLSKKSGGLYRQPSYKRRCPHNGAVLLEMAGLRAIGTTIKAKVAIGAEIKDDWREPFEHRWRNMGDKVFS